MSDRPRTRVAAYLVASHDDAILLCRIAPGYPGAGSWTLPGGGVEWGEHPEDALVREVYEESGFHVDDHAFLGIDSLVLSPTETHGGFHGIRLLFTAAVSGEPRVTEVDGSVDAAAWIPLADLDVTATVGLVDVGLRFLAEED